MDMSRYFAYQYSDDRSDAYWQRQQDLGRIHLAVMLQDAPIGEVILKNMDEASRSCVSSIHLQNDSDAIKKNQRSRHVLEKVGFRITRQDDSFIYYRCDRESWTPPIL